MRRFLITLSLVFILKAQADDAWTSSMIVAKSKAKVGNPCVAIDKDGNVVAIWVDTENDLYGIYSSVFDVVTQSWGLPEKVSEASCHEKKVLTPALSMDEKGNAIAIWGGDGIYATYYDALVKKWIPYEHPLKEEKGEWPVVSFDGDGNAIAVWHNKIASAIQVSHFDKKSMEWSKPKDLAESASYWGFFMHEYSPRTKIAMDKLGNAIAIWEEKKGKNRGVIQSAYYDRYTDTWRDAVDVTNERANYGFDVHISPDGNALAALSYSCYENTAIEVLNFDMSCSLWEYPGTIVSIGIRPIILTNDLNHKALGSHWFVSKKHCQFVGAIGDETSSSESWTKHAIVSDAMVFYYDLAMDDWGNVFAAWNEFDGDLQIQRAAFFSRDTKEWTQPKTLSMEPGESFGETAVAMHPCGHGAILWNGFDEAEQQYVIRAAVFQKPFN